MPVSSSRMGSNRTQIGIAFAGKFKKGKLSPKRKPFMPQLTKKNNKKAY